jgi:N-acetyl-alpha-D-glucosaminyl L-malate synthase BshA
VASVAEKYELDVVHAHYAYPHAASAVLAREICSRQFRIITTLHGTDIFVVGNDPVHSSMVRYGIDRSDVVTSVSRFLKNETQRIMNVSREIVVIHNFVDTQRFRPAEDRRTLKKKLLATDFPVLIHISNFRPIKRTPDLVHILRLVVRKRAATLLLLGDGPDLSEVRYLVREFGLTDRVIFAGAVTDVVPYIQASDVLLLTSEFEAFGLVALEAMACGVPTIVSHASSLPEIVGDAGLMIDPYRPDELLRALEGALRDRELLQSLRERGLARAGMFSWQETAHRTKELFRSLQ